MLKLRNFQEDDFEYLISWITDERLCCQWCGRDFSYPLDMLQLAKYKNSVDNSENEFAFTATDEHGMPVGHIGMRIFDEANGYCMLRYVIIGEKHLRGRGLGYEMVKLAVDYAFSRLGANAVCLKVFTFNTGAIKCYKKVGFETMNTSQQSFQFKNETWDRLIMCLKKDKWLRLGL